MVVLFGMMDVIACMVNRGNTGVCTEMDCSSYDIPSCLRYEQSGH